MYGSVRQVLSVFRAPDCRSTNHGSRVNVVVMLIGVPAVSLCVCVLGRSSQAADIWLGKMKANRVLFFGNSITFVAGPRPDIGWTGNWGMAASAEDKDYVHVLTNSIAQAAGGTPSIMATYNANFESKCLSYDLNMPLPEQYTMPYPGQLGFVPLSDQLAFKPDIVVVAIGENVPHLTTMAMQDQYKHVFEKLLALFRSSGNPRIFVRGCFFTDATKDAVMKQATAAAGGVFVDQSSPGQNPSNRARSEPANPYCKNNIVNGHPGDRGMKAIADSLFGAMVAHSIPEPNTMGLFVPAAPVLGGLAWRHRQRSRIR